MRSLRLSKRVRQLELWTGAVRFISSEIRYSATPLDRIVAKLANAEEYRELHVFEPCAQRLKATRDFASAWQEAVSSEKSRLALTQTDCEPILSLGGTLGTTDVEGQVADCGRCAQMLAVRLDAAREDCGKRGRMYASIGVLSGVFFIILLF